MMKKIMVLATSAVLSMVMCMTAWAAVGYVSDGGSWKYCGVDGSVTAIQNTGWTQDRNGWRFISEGDPSNTGFSIIDGKLYCFSDNGYMRTGWFQSSYYGSLNPITGEYKDALSNSWYYFLPDGSGATGWQQIDEKWYYFGPDSIMFFADWTPDGYFVSYDGYYDPTIEKEANDSKAFNEAEAAKTAEDKVQEVIDLTNEEREKRGLAPLERDESLMEAAAIRAEEIVENYSHTRPDGTSCSTVLDEYGISSRVSGENIVRGLINAAGAVETWMRSEGHKENILKSKYTKIGVGYNEEIGGWVQIFIKD